MASNFTPKQLDAFFGAAPDKEASGRAADLLGGTDQRLDSRGVTFEQAFLDGDRRGPGRASIFEDPKKETNDSISQFVDSFSRTAFHEFGPGLIGLEPSEQVKEFKRDWPVASAGAFILGTLGPYGLGAKLGLRVAFKTPILRKAVQFATNAERMEAAPFLTSAVKEAARIAPFSIGRVGLSAFGPDSAFEDTLKSASSDVLAFGALGGVGKLLRGRAAKRRSIKGEALIAKNFDTYVTNHSPQQKLQSIDTILKNNPISEAHMTEDLVDELFQVKFKLKEKIAKQKPPPRTAFVQALTGGRSPGFLNNLFAGGGRKGVKNIGLDELGEKELNSIYRSFRRVGDAEFFGNMQYPRLLRAETADASERLRKTFRNMKKVDSAAGDGVFIEQEAEGMWIMSKKIKGLRGKGKAGDEFLVYKTPTPRIYHKEAARFADHAERAAFHFDPSAEIQKVANVNATGKFMLLFKKAMQETPLTNPSASALSKMLAESMRPELRALNETKEGLGFLMDGLKSVVAPAMHQFSASPTAVGVWAVAKASFARANSRTEAIMFGKRGKTDASKSIFGSIWNPPERAAGGINESIKALTPRGRSQLMESFASNLTAAEARAKGFETSVVVTLRKTQKVMQAYLDEMSAVMKATGYDDTTATLEAITRARAMRGNHRLPVHPLRPDGSTDTAKTVFIASGKSEKAAIAEAESIKNIMREAGHEVRFNPREFRTYGRDGDIQHIAKTLNYSNPMTRRAAEGKLELIKSRPTDYVMTRNDFTNNIYGNIVEMERFNTDKLLRHIFDSEMKQVAESFPSLGKQLSERLGMAAGRQGPLAQKVDDFLDKTLEPLVGRRASDLVRTANQSMFALTLGMGDMGYVTVNALTPIQTVLPEIAYQMSASPERIAKYLDYSLVLGKQRPQAVGVLSPLRVMKQGMKALANPNDEQRLAFEWASENGHIGATFIEEVFGQTSTQAKSFKGLLSKEGKEGYFDWFKEFSSFLPGKSEELSRGYSFMVGHILGKDIWGLAGDDLLNYAAAITGRTNFLYTTADRPKVITGTVGSLFGLFKNWGMHYTANFMQYAGEAGRLNFKPLLWSMAGTTGLAGVGGLPLYGVADAFSRFATDKNIINNLYGALGYEDNDNNFIDGMQYGFPGLFGVSLQGRAAPTGNSIARDVEFLTQSAVLDRGSAIWDATGDLMKQWWVTGKHPANSQQTRDRLYRAFLPRTGYRAISVWNDNALRSLKTGNRIVDDVNFPRAAAFALGITPLDIEKTFEIQSQLFQEQNTRRENLRVFGRSYAEAELERDGAEMNDILKRAILQGIDIQSLLRSSRTHLRNMSIPTIERQFDDAVAREKTNALMGAQSRF